MNLYKVFKVFVEVMGTKVKMFVLEDSEEQIVTMSYFIQSLNPKEPLSAISYIVSPSAFIRKHVPTALH
jgi:hypothetical protein